MRKGLGWVCASGARHASHVGPTWQAVNVLCSRSSLFVLHSLPKVCPTSGQAIGPHAFWQQAGSALHARRLSSTFTEQIKDGPSLADFIRSSPPGPAAVDAGEIDLPSSFPLHAWEKDGSSGEFASGGGGGGTEEEEEEADRKRKVFVETYGCQMNASDSEIVMSIMQKAGYEQAAGVDEAGAKLLLPLPASS